MGSRKPSGRALAIQALVLTKSCKCGAADPATITQTEPTNWGVKIVGYCSLCIGNTEAGDDAPDWSILYNDISREE